jgi:hypothetical protein
VRRDEVPDFLAHLPFDERRGLPVPYMNQHYPDGPDAPMRPDFTAIWGPGAVACAQEKRCGICGLDLGYWVAFVGGPKSAANRAYQDPPFHPECADYAMTVCPHIVIGHHQRATATRLGRESGQAGLPGAPRGAVMARADAWVIGITRSYDIRVLDGYPVFRAAPFKRTRRFEYDEAGTLTEVPG